VDAWGAQHPTFDGVSVDRLSIDALTLQPKAWYCSELLHGGEQDAA
jgi:hypothetical protein